MLCGQTFYHPLAAFTLLATSRYLHQIRIPFAKSVCQDERPESLTTQPHTHTPFSSNLHAISHHPPRYYKESASRRIFMEAFSTGGTSGKLMRSMNWLSSCGNKSRRNLSGRCEYQCLSGSSGNNTNFIPAVGLHGTDHTVETDRKGRAVRRFPPNKIQIHIRRLYRYDRKVYGKIYHKHHFYEDVGLKPTSIADVYGTAINL